MFNSNSGLEMVYFNMQDGFLEGIVRGYRSGFLTQGDYTNMKQCENLDDLKLHLTGTDYGPYFVNEPSPIKPNTIVDRCTQKLVDDWAYMRAQADAPLGKFLDMCTYGHMIDNVVLMVTGTIHERDSTELREKCHPLGVFDQLLSVTVPGNLRELYQWVLIDTPLGEYFSDNLHSEDLDEMNIEILRNTLYKSYLEDFHSYCESLGNTTGAVMDELLSFEADKRAINITMNSFGTDLSRADRRKLYCDFGSLYPTAQYQLSSADDFDSVKASIEGAPAFKAMFTKIQQFGEGQMMDKMLYEEEIGRCRDSFQLQFHYGVYYAYMKLREQEIRNLMWIAECIAQNQKIRIQDGVVDIF